MWEHGRLLATMDNHGLTEAATLSHGPFLGSVTKLVPNLSMSLILPKALCNQMTTARRPTDLFEIWDLILEAGIETYNLSVPKHDLKRLNKY